METSTSRTGSDVSLGINYIPKKFPSSILTGGVRYSVRSRKGKNREDGSNRFIPKFGGGVDAFSSKEARVGRHNQRRARWNRFKWTLIITNTLLTLYSLAAVIVCLLFWFNVWEHADVIRVGNKTELIISTVAASFGLFTALIGWPGILLNNRPFLAWYTFFTWLTFAALVIPGYVTFRRRSLNLQGKINAQWSQKLGADGRLRIQNELQCCGYFSPFVEATVSATCYARSILPGCYSPYFHFQRFALARWYTVVFSLVPLQLGVMTAALLCSNQITYRFGKGMMPEQYRLNQKTMAAVVDNFADQLANQHGLAFDDVTPKPWVTFQRSESDITT